MSVKLQISAAVKLIFQGDGEVCPSVGKKFGDTKKKKEAPVLARHGLLMHIRIVFMYGFCSSYSPGTQRGTFPVYELVCIVSIKMNCVSLRWQ